MMFCYPDSTVYAHFGLFDSLQSGGEVSGEIHERLMTHVFCPDF